jgi:hypothetical protein
VEIGGWPSAGPALITVEHRRLGFGEEALEAMRGPRALSCGEGDRPGQKP